MKRRTLWSAVLGLLVFALVLVVVRNQSENLQGKFNLGKAIPTQTMKEPNQSVAGDPAGSQKVTNFVTCPSISNDTTPTLSWAPQAALPTSYTWTLERSFPLPSQMVSNVSSPVTYTTYTATSPLPDGLYVLNVIATDIVTHPAVSCSFEIDTVAPWPPIPSVSVSGNNIVFHVVVSGDGDAGFRYKVNTTGAWTEFANNNGSSNVNMLLSSFANNVYNVFFQAKDQAGNWSLVSAVNESPARVFVSNLNKPVLTNSVNGLTNVANQQFGLTSANDNVITIPYDTGGGDFIALNGNTFSTPPSSFSSGYAYPVQKAMEMTIYNSVNTAVGNPVMMVGNNPTFNYTFSNNGVYTVKFREVAMFGISGNLDQRIYSDYVTKTFTVDTVAPNTTLVVSNPQPSFVNFWTWTMLPPANDIARYSLKLDNGLWVNRMAGAPYYIANVPTGSAPHTLCVKAGDVAGNWTPESCYTNNSGIVFPVPTIFSIPTTGQTGQN